MKKILSFMLALTMILSTVMFAGMTEVFGAEIIAVYLDGDLIGYDANDAKPQIYNSRTYVPIRKTAETLGLSIDWNSKTETMTFSRDGITISHTMRSTIVYVNGSAVTFDTPSINVQNRTLMPVRMLAESIGAEVEWKNAERAVYITTSSPKVNSAEASSTIVASGTNVKLKATANNATTIKFVDADSSAVIAEVKEYIDNADGTRTFETNYTPNNTKSESVVKNIYAYAGNNSGYIESLADAGKITLMITPAEEKDKDKDKDKDDDENKKSEYLVKYKLDSKSVEKGDYARIKVTTTDDISRVKVTNSFSSTKAEQSQYEEDKNDQRVFDLKLKTTSRGSQSLYIYLYVEAEKDFDSAYETVPIKVVYEDEDDEDYGDLDIIDVEVYPDTIYKGETAYVTVYTTKDIAEVAIFDEDDKRVTRQLYETDTLNNKMVWELDFEVKHSDKQKYTVIAYDEDDEEAKDSFRVTGESYSSADLLVLSVNQKTADVIEGDNAKFDARCTSSTSYIIVTDSNGKELKKVTSSSKDGSVRRFSFNIEIEDIDDNYYVYAYNSDGSQKNSYKFKPRGTEEDDLEIKDIEVHDSSKIYRGDDVYVTVYTTTNVSRIWIEDDEEERVSKRMSKPDEESGSSYVWELEFEAEEKGRVTYTVIVEDENDNTFDESFNINVKK